MGDKSLHPSLGFFFYPRLFLAYFQALFVLADFQKYSLPFSFSSIVIFTYRMQSISWDSTFSTWYTYRYQIKVIYNCERCGKCKSVLRALNRLHSQECARHSRSSSATGYDGNTQTHWNDIFHKTETICLDNVHIADVFPVRYAKVWYKMKACLCIEKN